MQNPRDYEDAELGRIVSAGFAKNPPPFDTGGRTRGVRRLGQVYEYKWQEYAEQRFDYYVPSPWLVFRSETKPYVQWCQPDGLLFLPEKLSIIIVEVKLRHTDVAFWQIEKLYEPVLRKCFEGRTWSFRRLEVVKWFDPAAYFPCDPQLVQDPELTPRKGMGVHIWKS